MIKCFNEFIESRCDEALLANKEYRELQIELNEAYKSRDIEKYCELFLNLLVISECICYRLGIKDVYSFLNNN